MGNVATSSKIRELITKLIDARPREKKDIAEEAGVPYHEVANFARSKFIPDALIDWAISQAYTATDPVSRAIANLREAKFEAHQLTLIQGMIDQMRGFNEVRDELRLRPAPVSPEWKQQLRQEIASLDAGLTDLDERSPDFEHPDALGQHADFLRTRLKQIRELLNSAGLAGAVPELPDASAGDESNAEDDGERQ